MNETTSRALLASIGSDKVAFHPCDVRKYHDVVGLFRYAFERHGVIDHAVANAGIVERGQWFDANLTIESVAAEPDTSALDINLKGLAYFARVASVYMSHHKSSGQDKSLTLMSSAAGFLESRGLYMYQASKHGVLGLLRTARLSFPESMKGIRVNALCPSFVRTGMTQDLVGKWEGAGLPVNEPEDLAKAIAALAAADRSTAASMLQREEVVAINVHDLPSSGGMDWDHVDQTTGITGRSFYVEGGLCWDIEEGLDRTRHLWLGQTANDNVLRTQALLKSTGFRKRN